MARPARPGGRNRRAAAAVAVSTAKVETKPMIRSVNSLGTGIANQSIQLISPTSDFITELNVREGKAVQRGEVIAKLQDVDERARVTELEGILAEQKRQLDRLKNLANTQATAQSLLIFGTHVHIGVEDPEFRDLILQPIEIFGLDRFGPSDVIVRVEPESSSEVALPLRAASARRPISRASCHRLQLFRGMRNPMLSGSFITQRWVRWKTRMSKPPSGSPSKVRGRR